MIPKESTGNKSLKSAQPTKKLVIFVSTAVILVFALSAIAWNRFHDWDSVAIPDEDVGLKVFDRQDRPVCTLLHYKEFTPVALSKVSKFVPEAIVSTEDRGFYSHPGVSIESILRATLANIKAGHVVQGGSTITQQLVKNLYFSDDKRTMLAKLKEAAMAIELDHHYSKDKILESYLNWVYFGRGTFGIEQAAQKYFGIHASQLDLAQSAYLAALVNAPTRLSAHRVDATDRQNEILDNMVVQRFVTAEAAQKARAEKLIIKEAAAQSQRYAYYLNHVVELLEKDNFSSDQLWKQGTRVFTNLDPAAQVLADRTLTQGIKKAPAGVSQGALVSISVSDGGVLAMVGGVGGFDKSPWNRALSPHTAGSAFKPFVYLTGLQMGILKPDTTIYDAPLTIDMPGQVAYSPKNFDANYLGPITIRKALALSRNTCAIRVTQAVTPANVVLTAQAAGITSKLEPTLALGLGASAVSPIDMANGYATLARSGLRITPSFIRKVESKDKKVLRQYINNSVKVFEPEPVAELVDAMQDVVQKGTGTQARLFDRPVAGKTGTADGARDIWFIGFTPDVVTAVWGGNDQNLPIAGTQVTGGSVMAGIWQTYMKSYYQTHETPPGAFVAPQTPLAQEVDEIHYLPKPAGIFDKIAHFLDPSDFPTVAPNKMPPVAPPIGSGGPNRGNNYGIVQGHSGDFGKAQSRTKAQDRQPPKKGIKNFFHKLFKMF